MGLNYCASAPVLTLPQSSYFMQHHHHDEFGTPNYAIAPAQSPVTKKCAPRYPTPPSLNYLAQSSNASAGRKRSRDETDDHGDAFAASAGPVQPPLVRRTTEPVLGPDMTLIYPDEPALSIAPESQSGTWLDDKVEATPADGPVAARPIITARKSQRRSVDESKNATVSEQTDPVVLRLGIGWKRISEAQASGIAGSEAYIRNQYPYVRQPKILLQHEGLGLVVARSDPIDQRGLVHQYWLFTEDLNQCRLLCNSDEDEVFRRLSNKRQDERGNWIPNILTDGQIISAKDSTVPIAPVVDSVEVMEIDQ
ncbi:hypothetical protein EJ08DRAFT_645839 [Tothia fuscella]|uniref:Uncharacterized protein n=1 Tax=Tothia fuscella TaxID=1048955 RepID=A0A9P4NZT7_9PEZI|nr:hypothetical protein EJ08DRAFT_645839 [Tothia fuscella]